MKSNIMPSCQPTTIHTPVGTFRVHSEFLDITQKTLISYRQFWNQYQSKLWEPNTLNAIQALLKPHQTYLDIGAWIGPTFLYAHLITKNVIAIEPDPIAHQILTLNTKLNQHHTTIIKQPLWINNRPLKLHYSSDLGDSSASITTPIHPSDKSFTTKPITLPQLIKQLQINKLDFVKMDIEGAEFTILPNITKHLIKHQTTLLLSIHPKHPTKSTLKTFSNSLSSLSPIFDIHLLPISINQIEDKIQLMKPFEIITTHQHISNQL